jgi:hypothetical protein
MRTLVGIASLNNKKHVENHVETILTDLNVDFHRDLFKCQSPNYLTYFDRIRYDSSI